MAGSVNKVILIGNLGRDPEIRTFQSGGRVAHLNIATSESWKDKATGERKDRTEWHRISILNENLIGVAERFLKKGAKVYIEGQLETRKWTDQSGQEKYSTEIVLRPFRGELTMLDGANNNRASGGLGNEPPASAYEQGGASSASAGFSASQPSSGASASSDLDDHIPF